MFDTHRWSPINPPDHASGDRQDIRPETTGRACIQVSLVAYESRPFLCTATGSPCSLLALSLSLSLYLSQQVIESVLSGSTGSGARADWVRPVCGTRTRSIPKTVHSLFSIKIEHRLPAVRTRRLPARSTYTGQTGCPQIIKAPTGRSGRRRCARGGGNHTLGHRGIC